jgi:cephalosporin hydroxylase
MRRDYRKRLKMSLKQWLIHHQKTILFDQCSWMGVGALKNPFDAWIYQEILYEVQPDVVVEIGSAEGGSTLFLANLLDLLGNGSVVSIDIDRSTFQVEHDRIHTLTGDSTSPEIVAQVAELCEGKKTLVIDDGNHRKEYVLENLRSYSKFVTVGSYFIVEDGIMDLFRPGDGIAGLVEGPLAASEAFLKENHDFQVDTSRERYLLTYNPRGFLRRVA